MDPIEFKEVNVRIAEHQDEFVTLPAFFDAKEGSMTFCFKLNQDELNRIKATEEIWFKMITYGMTMPPIVLSTNKEELILI